MQVRRQAGRYDAKRAAPRTWLLMIARSRAIDALRAFRRKVPNQPLGYNADAIIDHSADAEEILAAKRWRVTVRTAVASLTPDQREASELAFYGGMSHSAIAFQLGKPLGSVKSNIRAGMLRAVTADAAA